MILESLRIPELEDLLRYRPVLKLSLNLFEGKNTSQQMFQDSENFMDEWLLVRDSLQGSIISDDQKKTLKKTKILETLSEFFHILLDSLEDGSRVYNTVTVTRVANQLIEYLDKSI